MRALPVLVFAYAVIACSEAASASDWIALPMSNQHAITRGYVFDLGEADDSKNPRNWQGPIVITSPGGRSCQVSEDVELITRPVDLWQDKFLYVDTYSGSMFRLFVVDVQTCRIAWGSPRYYGPEPLIEGHSLRLAGHPPFHIGADGLPTTNWRECPKSSAASKREAASR